MNPRFSRQSFLGNESDSILGSLTVAVVGLGGGGSHLVQQLPHLGVKQFVLFDPDRVEISNLNRLVGATVRDVFWRRRKTAIASRLIKRLSPQATVIARHDRWQNTPSLLHTCDMIFGCVDSFSARDELERTARRHLIPYIDIGMDVQNVGNHFSITGQVALSLPSEPCLRCMSIITPDKIKQEASNYGAAGHNPQVIWSNGVLASMAVGLAVQLILPWAPTENPTILLEYDGNVPDIRPPLYASLLRKRRCPHFDEQNDVGDPWFRL